MLAGWITPDLQLECQPRGRRHCACEGNASLSLCLCILKVNCKVYEANLWACITFWLCACMRACVRICLCLCKRLRVCVCV